MAGALLGYGAGMPNTSRSSSRNVSQSTNQSANQSSSQSGSFIPEYSQTPILESIAQYAQSMAPQVYEWGMGQWANNQGDIDALMRSADTWASGQRLATDMGAAEAGVTQAGERGLENSRQELESYGIDPSSGRYAALDQASRVQTAAAAAGAGNQQRNADIAQANTMRNQAIAAQQQNSQFGLGVGADANNFLSTAIRLPYSPLGNQSSSSSYGQSYGQSSSEGGSSSSSESYSGGGGGGGGHGGGQQNPPPQGGGGSGGGSSGGGYPGGGGGGDSGGGGGGFGGGGRSGGDDMNNVDPGGGVLEGGAPLGQGGIGSDYNGGYGSNWPEGYVGDPGSPYDSNADTGWGQGYGTSGGEAPADSYISGSFPEGAVADSMPTYMAEGGPVGYDPDQDGPSVSPSMSPSGGQEVDDVPAQLNAGEFVLPDDVVKWKGEEFFQNLISKSRQARESIMQAHGQMQGQGMNMGGAI